MNPSQTNAPIRPRDPRRLSRLAGEVALRQYSKSQIHAWQSEIHSEIMQTSRVIDSPNFTRVHQEDLKRMIRLYDDRFFGGRLLPVVEAEGLSFKLSSRMTRIAGKMTTQYPNGYEAPRKFEIAVSTTLLFQTFDGDHRPVEVSGRKCLNRLEAMQRVAEHELVHLVEMLIWNDGDCGQPRFQSIASRYFDHTEYQHDLITQNERAAVKFKIRVGNLVEFVHDRRRYRGIVNRITRRATVLVESPKGRPYNDGKRYEKFYIPLEKLKVVDVAK
ncbi:MAG: hypothetical protein AAF664_16985 [Planctomycetota bacterium]